MSRSGYSDELDQWDLIRWRGAVKAGIRGKRGQAFLKEMLAALDAMPVKELIAESFEDNGQHCALGVVAAQRRLDISELDEDEPSEVGALLNIPRSLAAEIAFENDGDFGCDRHDTPERRFLRMRAWVAERITP